MNWYHIEEESAMLRMAVDSGDDDAIALALALEMYFDDTHGSSVTTYSIHFTPLGACNVGIGV